MFFQKGEKMNTHGREKYPSMRVSSSLHLFTSFSPSSLGCRNRRPLLHPPSVQGMERELVWSRMCVRSHHNHPRTLMETLL